MHLQLLQVVGLHCRPEGPLEAVPAHCIVEAAG
jgi:hypothetical protein